jgi:hypothetical protein
MALSLTQKNMTVKFYKNVIIGTKAIDQQKMCAKTQNMENIFKWIEEPADKEWPMCVIDKPAPLATWT